MSMTSRDRMARETAEEIRQGTTTVFTSTGRHHDSSYSQASLRALGGEVVEAALRGELGRTSVKGVARDFFVSDAMVRALLEQVDGKRRLNFLTEGIVKVQTREMMRELLDEGGDGRLVYVRTQPTSPTTGIRISYGENSAFGLTPGRKAGAVDSLFATYASPRAEGREQSVNLAGLVPALDKDRNAWRQRAPMDHLSPLQHLSLTRPTAAMFRQAGAVDLAAKSELASEIEACYIFLQGRYEGYEESVFLSSPTHTVPIVNEEGYQQEARDALGDEIDIVIEAEGISPHDRGLERRHIYVDEHQQRTISNTEVRRIIDTGMPYMLDRDYISEEHRGVALMLMPGELRAGLRGGRHEGGQALLQMTGDGPMRWFTLLNKSSGRRAWSGSGEQLRPRLKRLAESFALLEAPASTAGAMRRDQFRSLEEFDVPMSHPSGRQNVWSLAAAVRQAGLGEASLGVARL